MADLLTIPRAFSQALGRVWITQGRHGSGAYYRSSMGTGQGRRLDDFNRPQYYTGGDNYGSAAWIWIGSPAVTSTQSLVMNSLINFFADNYWGGGILDEAGWIIQPAYCSPNGVTPEYQVHPFTDNGITIQCHYGFTLAFGTWYSFVTQPIANTGFGPTGWNNWMFDGIWHLLDTRYNLPSISSGLDHGIESTPTGVSGSSSAFSSVQQITSFGANYTLVGPGTPSYEIENGPMPNPPYYYWWTEIVSSSDYFYTYGP